MRSAELPQNLREYTLIIFDPLGLVKNEKIKLMLLELVLLLHDSFECGDHDIILVVSDGLLLTVSLFSIPIESKHSDCGYPLLQLLEPFAKHDLGDNHYVMGISPLDLLLGLVAFNQSYDCYRLDGLSETHFVC